MFTIKLGDFFEIEVNPMSVYIRFEFAVRRYEGDMPIRGGAFERFYNLHGLDSH